MKLSPQDAERLNQHLPDIANLDKEVFEFAKTPWVEKFLRRTGTPPFWHWAYELSIPELSAYMASLTDGVDILLQASREGHSVLLDSIEEDSPSAAQSPPKRRHVLLVMALTCALAHTIRSIGYHSMTMDELIDKGLSGDPLSLRRAVAIDPTILAHPGVAAYISWLRVQGEKRELRKLFHAAEKGPNKQLAPNWQLRYMERVLHEGQILSSYSREDVYKLVVEKMKLYGTKSDSFKGLNTLFTRWRQDATT